jgi:hypothetical protein
MAKTIATLVGIVFILVGIIGFFSMNFMGAHLTKGHNIIHLVSGVVSLYIGLKGSLSAAKTFGLVFGAVYLLLGVAGFLLGNPSDDRMLTLIDNRLFFGTMDHIIHIAIGAIYLIGALLTKGAPAATVDA